MKKEDYSKWKGTFIPLGTVVLRKYYIYIVLKIKQTFYLFVPPQHTYKYVSPSRRAIQSDGTVYDIEKNSKVNWNKSNNKRYFH